jgi:hypothetical protein
VRLGSKSCIEKIAEFASEKFACHSVEAENLRISGVQV